MRHVALAGQAFEGASLAALGNAKAPFGSGSCWELGPEDLNEGSCFAPIKGDPFFQLRLTEWQMLELCTLQYCGCCVAVRSARMGTMAAVVLLPFKMRT
jgi:hypothetical protein